MGKRGGGDERASEARGSPETAEDGGGGGELRRARAAAWRRPWARVFGAKDAAVSGVYMGGAGDRIPHESETKFSGEIPGRRLETMTSSLTSSRYFLFILFQFIHIF